MSDAAFLRIVVNEAVRAVVGTAPSLAEQERAVMAASVALSRSYAGETVSMYVPKVGTDARARRAREIRAMWTGCNAGFLASKYGLSERQVRRIAGHKPSE